MINKTKKMFSLLVGSISGFYSLLQIERCACGFVIGSYIWQCYVFFPHLFWTILYTCLNFYTYFRIHLTRYKTQEITKVFDYSEFSRKHFQRVSPQKGALLCPFLPSCPYLYHTTCRMAFYLRFFSISSYVILKNEMTRPSLISVS